jgi:hypothetical protein
VLATFPPGAHVSLLVARDGRLRTLEAQLDTATPPDARIVARADAGTLERARYAAWLGEDFSTAPQARR